MALLIFKEDKGQFLLWDSRENCGKVLESSFHAALCVAGTLTSRNPGTAASWSRSTHQNTNCWGCPPAKKC